MKFLFNFKPQFCARVEAGQKLQTIRQPRADGKRPTVGDVACLYTGLRTAKARLLREAPVTRCRAIRMDFGDDSLVIDGRKVSFEERVDFAQSDGFATWTDMRRFFLDQYGRDVFEGFCVEWEPPCN